MSPEAWATFSNQAFAAAAVVLALSWLAHLLEFAAGRTVPAHDREAALVGAGAPVVEERAGSPRVELLGRIGLSLSILGTAVLVAGAVSRGLAAERVPWGNMFEFATTGAAVAMVVYLILVRLYSVQWLGAVVTGFAVVVLGLSMLVYVAAGPLVPALDSYWLVLHVAAAPRRSTCSRRARSEPRKAATTGTCRACPPRRRWTGSPTGCMPSRSRCGRSRR
jgi:hypothetical protein